MEIAERTMQDLQQVVSTPRPQAVLKGFGDSAVIVGLLFWIDKPNPGRKWRTQTAVIRAVKEAYEKEFIFRFPSRRSLYVMMPLPILHHPMNRACLKGLLGPIFPKNDIFSLG